MNSYLISIVIPTYNEEQQIYGNVLAIHALLHKHGIHHEFVLVDDGSKDNTWGELKRVNHAIPSVHLVKLSRNFGKESALCAGLDAMRGNACIVMDSDLQHPPELIPEMVRLWREEGYEVVEGAKTARGNESRINKLGALFFYKLLQKTSGFDLNRASDFKLLDGKVVDAWKRMGERNTFFRAMSAWVGFKRIQVPFVVADRAGGNSKWSMYRLFMLAIGAITSFSSLPLQIVTFMGVIFLVTSFGLASQTLYMYLTGEAFTGFTTVILLLLIEGSVLMISLGIIGTYIARIFEEVKGRPRYLVAEEIFQDTMPREPSE